MPYAPQRLLALLAFALLAARSSMRRTQGRR